MNLSPLLFSLPFAEDGPPAGMDPFAGTSSPFLTIALVVLVMLIVWWLLQAQIGQVEPVGDGHHGHDDHDHDMHAVAAVETHAPTMAAVVEPETMEVEESSGEPAVPDDLKKLEGVGPKVQEVLNAAGFVTFAQVADGEVEKLQAILDAAGYQYMNPGSWPEQARLADAGDWDGLQKLQDELNVGK